MSDSLGVPIDKVFPMKCATRLNLELSTEKIVSCHRWSRLKIAFPWKLIVNQNLWTTNNCKEGKNLFVTNPRSRLSLTCRTWRVAFHHAFKSAFVWLRAIINVHCFAKLQMGLLNLAVVIRSLNHRRARRFFSKTVAASRRRRNLSLIQNRVWDARSSIINQIRDVETCTQFSDWVDAELWTSNPAKAFTISQDQKLYLRDSISDFAHTCVGGHWKFTIFSSSAESQPAAGDGYLPWLHLRSEFGLRQKPQVWRQHLRTFPDDLGETLVSLLSAC